MLDPFPDFWLLPQDRDCRITLIERLEPGSEIWVSVMVSLSRRGEPGHFVGQARVLLHLWAQSRHSIVQEVWGQWRRVRRHRGFPDVGPLLAR